MGLSGKIVPLPRPIREPRGAYLMISKPAEIQNKENLIQKISDTLKKMEEDGTIERISSIYLH